MHLSRLVLVCSVCYDCSVRSCCVLDYDVASFFFFFKQKTAYDMRISDWSSDVCSSDLTSPARRPIQTTRDIASFWGGSWHDVAREMRGLYPKIGRASCRERVCQYV